ncbi:hypothetical protein [Peromfec virus RodF8_46]|uniref:Internal scaffolding protein n=1 Tax=Peromfec virus RodF8_46 TaxID=2929377 RepID=A0A976N207_9VIRU|nr:hypothetical protein [Peromfec virus RodF8_46]
MFQSLDVLPQMRVDSESYYTSFSKDPKGRSLSDRFFDNPLITDVSQSKQCDLKYIFSQNPDINGMSLIVDDASREEELSSISVEDFLEPKDHYDIFDAAEFIDNAKRQFRKLPGALRSFYGDNPINLCRALDSDYSGTVSKMQEFFSPLLPSENSAATPPVGSPASPAENSSDDKSSSGAKTSKETSSSAG